MPKKKDEGVLNTVDIGRRSMIKGLAFIGTAVAASSVVPTGDVEAARKKSTAKKKKGGYYSKGKGAKKRGKKKASKKK